MKKRNKLCFLLLFFTLKLTVSFAQIDTSFWFAAPWVTPDHWWRDPVVMHITALNAPATVRLRQPASINPLKYDTTIIVAAGTTTNVTFWKDAVSNATVYGYSNLETIPANTVVNNGIYISSTASIVAVYDVVTRLPNSFNTETFSLKGQNGLGLEFVCPFQTIYFNQTIGDLNGDGTSTQPKQQINIVASKPNTVVWIKPRCNVVGHLANITYSVLLPSPGSAYTIENAVQSANLPGNNLSGTIVVADKPISVTVADDSAKSPLRTCYDLMGDQIVPVNFVGTDYIFNLGQLYTNMDESGFIVATENFTKLTINNGSTTTVTINKGDTYQVKLTAALTYVNADKNVYAIHASGFGCELGEAILPPLNCAGSKLVPFSRNTNQNFNLNILCKNGSQSTFTLNASTTSVTAANFTVVPGTGSLPGGPYWGAQVAFTSTTVLPIGSYTIGNNSNEFALGVFDGGFSSGGLFHYMSAFFRKPTVIAQPTTQVCASPTASVILTGTVGAGASTGTWTAVNGTGVFGTYSSTLNTITVPYFLSSADTLVQPSIKFYLNALDACGKPYKDSTYLFINQRPKVLASGNISMCKNNIMPIVLSGTITNANTGGWTGGNGGTFSSPSPTTAYNPSPSDLSAGTITLTLTSAGPLPGCLNSAKSITVNFVNPPVVNAGADITACTNSQTVALNGGISGITNTGIWTSSGTGLFLPNSNTTTPIYQFSANDLLQPSISFTLTSTNNGLCASTKDFMQINIIPKPFVDAPANFTICATSVAVVLTGSVGGSASAGTWAIAPGQGSGAFSPVSPPATVTYSLSQNDTLVGSVNLYLSSSGGICPTEKDSVRITILRAPNISITSNSISICRNAPINLTAVVAGGTSYTWVAQSSSTGTFSSPGAAGLISPPISTIFAQYNPTPADVGNGSVSFTVLISNAPCIPTTKSVTAYFIASPKALFTVPNTGRCLNKSLPFTDASLDNGTAPLSYNWNFGAGLGNSITQNPIYTYTNVGSYVITLSVTGQNSCIDTVSKRITIYPLPIPNFSVTNACQNINSVFQNLTLVPGGGGSVTAITWNFGDSNVPLNTGLTSTVVHVYANPGPYNASFTITTNYGCTSTTIIPITINPKPKAEFGMTNNPSVAQEPVYFSDFSTPTGGIANWLWQFGDETSASGPAPTHNFANPGIYFIKLTVNDANGCSDTISKSIEVVLVPQVPTGFTPNKDNNNDLLFVKGGPFQNMKFRVYNNWGELLFETTDQKIGWDGTKNGIDQPVGVYVWTLEVDLYNNRQVKKNGDITLIR